MGLKIRHWVPAVAGTRFTYSVERRADGEFFDFEQSVFRPLEHIPSGATAGRMVRRGGAVIANFAHMEAGKEYIVRVQQINRDGPVTIVVLPILNDWEEPVIRGKRMGVAYRSGKKFLDGQVIEARHRYTFHGNDGFTVHTATLWEDGTSSCNCPRWGKSIDRFGNRSCVHSERAATLTENIDETGAQPDLPSPAMSQTTSPFRRRRRSIDT